jgi:mannose-6-phosphate isomerase
VTVSAIRLETKSVEKPWGRTDLPAIFPHPANEKIGEIWFEGPGDQHPPLLVKYIFTSEKLSIQVHPNDQQAHDRGLPGGKSECWYVLDAEPNATLGIGLTEEVSGSALRAAALDGSIEKLIDWKPVERGTFYYIPAGTVHAIGAGITLIEVQLNNDVTYRLYDYGRPRELHLEAGIAVSKPEPYARPSVVLPLNEAATLLDKASAPFSLEMVTWDAGQVPDLPNGTSWFIPLSGSGAVGTQSYRSGECWLAQDGFTINVQEKTCAFLARM